MGNEKWRLKNMEKMRKSLKMLNSFKICQVLHLMHRLHCPGVPLFLCPSVLVSQRQCFPVSQCSINLGGRGQTKHYNQGRGANETHKKGRGRQTKRTNRWGRRMKRTSMGGGDEQNALRTRRNGEAHKGGKRNAQYRCD